MSAATIHTSNAARQMGKLALTNCFQAAMAGTDLGNNNATVYNIVNTRVETPEEYRKREEDERHFLNMIRLLQGIINQELEALLAELDIILENISVLDEQYEELKKLQEILEWDQEPDSELKRRIKARIGNETDQAVIDSILQEELNRYLGPAGYDADTSVDELRENLPQDMEENRSQRSELERELERVEKRLAEIQNDLEAAEIDESLLSDDEYSDLCSAQDDIKEYTKLLQEALENDQTAEISAVREQAQLPNDALRELGFTV